MPSAFEEVFIGPFVGGLNTLSDQTSIGDTELFQCDNFELDQDGSLVSRPPIRTITSNFSSPASSLNLLGYFVDSSTGAIYLIASNRIGATFYYSSGSWISITSNFAATACLQYRDKLYLVAPVSSASSGGTWTPTTGFSADSNMPKGTSIVSNKDRLWICQGKDAPSNGSRIYVTDIVGGAPVWNGNFISVSAGDGQNVVDLCVYNSDLIIFKQESTYRFSFGSDVSSGYISTLSRTVGANNTGCYVAYEQQLFIVFNRDVYEFTNYIFNKINITTPLKTSFPSTSYTETVGISAWSSRLFVNYFEKLYVYNLRNRTWSTWSSPNKVVSFGKFLPVPFAQAERPQAYLYSNQPLGTDASRKLFQCVDLIEPGIPGDATNSELMTCTIETKNYDFQTPSKWKRLAWWGGDFLSRTDLQVFAQPVQYAVPTTWNQASAYTWNSPAIRTWDQPLAVSTTVVDTLDVEASTIGRKFIKFLKSLRFRQISFKVIAETYGTDTTAPIRIYRLSTYVREKQRVSKKMN